MYAASDEVILGENIVVNKKRIGQLSGVLAWFFSIPAAGERKCCLAVLSCWLTYTLSF